MAKHGLVQNKKDIYQLTNFLFISSAVLTVRPNKFCPVSRLLK
ncbi:hypothetical protein LAC1533_0971 [Ligilactobacillus acidipiscis]|uniref:Uncharacterized protein n=1 Tax=Ligilactobacillus acidipiscis TaxID=89059 RepID=A0A1K1KNB1_9LACO|nr:hypothetical protein LAC1533_0971 [Ligilactobacillus acidipiscis]